MAKTGLFETPRAISLARRPLRLTVVAMVIMPLTLAMLVVSAPAWGAEGDLDASFSGDGRTTTPVGVGGFVEGASDVVVQPDGRIVAGGSAIGVGTGRDFALARYEADGELDASFGNGGKVLTDMGANDLFAEDVSAIALQSDGKIVAVGITEAVPNQSVIAVARYNPNGTLDTSFDSDGKLVLDIIGSEEFASDVAVQPGDGKIVIAGRIDGGSGAASNNFLLVRLDSNGSLDTTFDGNGIASTDINASFDHARAVAVDSSGRIVTAGEAGNNFAIARYDANGSLDTSFDTDGKVVTDMSTRIDFIEDVAIQTDGKIVAAGRANNDFALVRYNSNGSLDTNADADPSVHFDTDGKVFTDFGSGSAANSLAVAGDGKITAAGEASVDGNSNDFAAARYTANGSLDTSFAGDGKRLTDFGDTSDFASGIALQADGKAVVAGSSNGRFALARYATNGNNDGAFSFDGKVATVMSTGGSDVAEAAAIQTDGKTVVAGSAPAGRLFQNYAVVRYNKNGTLDTTFGGDGKVITEFEVGSVASDVAIQPDGKILVAGSILGGANRFAVVRYNPNGTLDETFSNDGVQTTGFADGAQVEAMEIQPNGKIVLAGTVFSDDDEFALARYNPDGSLDTTFDTDGRVTTSIGPGDDRGRDVTLQSDKIVVVGTADESADSSSREDFAIARYNANGSLDNTFDGDGRVTTPVSAPDRFEDVQAVLAQPDGKIVVGGEADPTGNFDSGFALVRYDANGSLDTAFDDDGIRTDPALEGGIRGLALQNGGKIVAAGGIGGGAAADFVIARYNPNGALDTTFSGDGVQTTDFLGSTDRANAVVVGGDSRITVAGFARNGTGNEDFAVARYIGDAIPPDTTITSGPPAKTKKTAARFTFASEPGARFQCSLDGSAFAACASPKSFSGLSRGKHTFRVRAIDGAGNVDPTPASRSWTVKAVRRR